MKAQSRDYDSLWDGGDYYDPVGDMYENFDGDDPSSYYQY